MTPEEIEDQIRADHPEFRISEGDEVTVISPETDAERYEQMIDERVAWGIEQQERDAAQQADQDEGKGIMEKIDALENTAGRLKDPTVTFSNQQLRNVMAEHMLVTAQSIRYIHKHSNLPQAEEG